MIHSNQTERTYWGATWYHKNIIKMHQDLFLPRASAPEKQRLLILWECQQEFAKEHFGCLCHVSCRLDMWSVERRLLQALPKASGTSATNGTTTIEIHWRQTIARLEGKTTKAKRGSIAAMLVGLCCLPFATPWNCLQVTDTHMGDTSSSFSCDCCVDFMSEYVSSDVLVLACSNSMILWSILSNLVASRQSGLEIWPWRSTEVPCTTHVSVILRASGFFSYQKSDRMRCQQLVALILWIFSFQEFQVTWGLEHQICRIHWI